MRKIAVVGSINIDYFMEADRLPELGETVLGKNLFLSLGGKGANQAVAASRLGGKVALFGSVGDDENSKIIVENMKKENVVLNNLNVAEGTTTGAAFIELCNSENRILVVPGANDLTNVSYIKRVLEELLNYDVILFQMETPLEMMEYIVPILFDHNKTIIVNPAPANKIRQDILEKITYITPNEHEYQMVLGSDESMAALLEKYPNKLIITRGTEGVSYFDGEALINVPVIKVEAVDTTGAGDTFSGAFAVGVVEGKSLKESIRFANVAAGLSVMKKGAQTGMPFRHEVDLLLKEELEHENEGHVI